MCQSEITATPERFRNTVFFFFFTVCSAHGSVAVHPEDESYETMHHFPLTSHCCNSFQHILTANTGLTKHIRSLFTCDRRIAQSIPNDTRVQRNTHRHPCAAVKSHWCKRRGKKIETVNVISLSNRKL